MRLFLEGTIKMAKNRFNNKRTRHVAIKHHIVRDEIEGEDAVGKEQVGVEGRHKGIFIQVLDVKPFETETGPDDTQQDLIVDCA